MFFILEIDVDEIEVLYDEEFVLFIFFRIDI